MPSPESLLERESRRSKTEVEEVEIFLKEAAVEVEQLESVLFLNADLSLKEKRGMGDVERGAGEAVEGHSEKIPESRRLSPSPSLKSYKHTGSFKKNGKSKMVFMGTKFHEKLIFSAFFSRELATNLRS